MTKYPACHGSGGFAYVSREPKTVSEHFSKWAKTDVKDDPESTSVQLSDIGSIRSQLDTISAAWLLPGRLLLGICLGYYSYRYLWLSALVA